MKIIPAIRRLFVREQKALNPVPYSGGWRTIFEPFAGAWQRNIEEKHGDITCYPTVYACMSRIARDIGKLPFVLKHKGDDRIWREHESAAYSPVLRKPNHYQTAQQFREAWQLSKLQQGNAYIMKQRDERGVVVKLHILDPCKVKPLVSDTGAVYYELWTDNLNLLPELDGKNLIVPAREIIHDREMTIHHPLIGVPPLCAAYWPAVKNLRIIRNESQFFGNGATPGGVLEVPGAVASEIIDEIERRWQQNFTGPNAGKVAVLSDGMKYTAMKASSADSQLVEQMRYSDEQICFAFGIPPYKIGIGPIPPGWKSEDVNIQYHSDALSDRIEHMENLLDEGLNISRPLGVELDISPLWRMDEGTQAEVVTKLIQGMTLTPDEGRFRLGYGSTDGGNTLWGQKQDFPLGVLATNHPDTALANNPAPERPDETEQARALLAAVEKALIPPAFDAMRDARMRAIAARP